MTEFIDFFWIILALYISFIARTYAFFLDYTFQTFPKPPLPIGYNILKKDLHILVSSVILYLIILEDCWLLIWPVLYC